MDIKRFNPKREVSSYYIFLLQKTLVNQTRTKTQQTLEVQIQQPAKTVSFNVLLELKED